LLARGGFVMHDILAHASSYEARSHSLRFAAQIAKLFHGPLTGIFVAEPVMPVPEMGMPPLFPEIAEVAAEVIREAQKAGGAFQSWAETMGVKQSRWQVAVGHLPSALAGAANWHDLLVLESAIKAPWSSVGALGQVLLTCGAPCLVVPDTYGRDASLKAVAIASNGTAESVRAVHAALPLLRLAEHIELLQASRPTIYVALRIAPYHDRGVSKGAHAHRLHADLVQIRWLRLDSGEVLPLAHQTAIFDIDQGIVKNHIESAVIIPCLADRPLLF